LFFDRQYLVWQGLLLQFVNEVLSDQAITFIRWTDHQQAFCRILAAIFPAVGDLRLKDQAVPFLQFIFFLANTKNDVPFQTINEFLTRVKNGFLSAVGMRLRS